MMYEFLKVSNEIPILLHSVFGALIFPHQNIRLGNVAQRLFVGSQSLCGCIFHMDKTGSMLKFILNNLACTFYINLEKYTSTAVYI